MDEQKKPYEAPALKELGSGLLAKALHDVWSAKAACESFGWARVDESLWNKAVAALNTALEALKVAAVAGSVRERAAKVADDLALNLRMRAKVQGGGIDGDRTLKARASAVEDVAKAIRALDIEPVGGSFAQAVISVVRCDRSGALCVYVNDRRVAGELHGPGTILVDAKVSPNDILKALMEKV